MSQTLQNTISDNFRSETQLAWIVLLLASFALGALIIWVLSNQQLLLPSVIKHDNSISQLSPLPKRPQTVTSGNSLSSASAVDPVPNELPQEELPQEELVLSAVDQAEVAQAESVEDEGAQTDRSPRERPGFIESRVEPIGAEAAATDQLQVLDPSSNLALGDSSDKLVEDRLLLAELTEASQAVVMAELPPETTFEKGRREELAMLSQLSAELQIDAKAKVLDTAATSLLYQIFELLFLYSETSVSVLVKSNDTPSMLRNIMLAQERGDQIVDYLVLSGLNRDRFTVIAESSAESSEESSAGLALGSHRIAIQATLDE